MYNDECLMFLFQTAGNEFSLTLHHDADWDNLKSQNGVEGVGRRDPANSVRCQRENDVSS